jgi:hypothetical protein
MEKKVSCTKPAKTLIVEVLPCGKDGPRFTLENLESAMKRLRENRFTKKQLQAVATVSLRAMFEALGHLLASKDLEEAEAALKEALNVIIGDEYEIVAAPAVS